jgi:hypothetical protein
VAHALRRLANHLESRAGRPPPVVSEPTSPEALPRRFAAVLAARASEITSLRTLLAQAVRPGRRRCRATYEARAQLTLPLSEATYER